MKKGRPPNLEPRRRVNAYVREDLYTRFTLIHFDETGFKAKYGAFSEFVNDALAEYLRLRENQNLYMEDKERIEKQQKQQSN